jgi:hypothetical protein
MWPADSHDQNIGAQYQDKKPTVAYIPTDAER